MKVTVSVYLHNVIMIVGRLLLKHAHVSARRHVVLLSNRTATQYMIAYWHHHVVRL